MQVATLSLRAPVVAGRSTACARAAAARGR